MAPCGHCVGTQTTWRCFGPLSTAHFNISALDSVSVSIYGLFNDALSSSNYMVSNGRIVHVLAEI
jgi:hypothetical protein